MTDSAKPTLLVVDGHSLAYRAFFALPVDNFTTKDGQHTNGIYGFLAMLINLIKAEKPTHLAVAFDTSRQSFRTREYAEYKANRSESPSEFKGQIPLLQDCLAAMSITVLQKEDFEADDILATLATQGADLGYDVLVCSGDRDTIQLVNDDITLLYPNVQGVSQLKRYDTAAVIERYGVRPEQYPDIAALVGETSDNLPGVPKVGEKTAVKWLGQFGSLDNLLENADKVTGVVGSNLRENIDAVRRNRTLNRLLTDVELPLTVPDLEVQPMDAQAVRDIFARLEFKTLIPRVAELAGIEQQMAAVTTAAAVPLPIPVEPSPADLSAWLAASDGEVGVTVIVEGGHPQRIGFARADAAAEASWSPEVAAALADWLASDAPKIFSDAKPQVKALRRVGLGLGGLAFDTIMTGWLLRPSFPDKTLAHLVDRYLDEKLPESDPTQLVPETEGATPGQLSWFTLRVTEALRAELAESVASVLTDIELPTLLTLADMELAGVAVSHAKLSEFSAELGRRADAIALDAYAAIGREVNLGSPKQLQEVLFEELQLPKTRKTKTGYSTDAAVLVDLQESNPHPFLDLLLQHREATKLRQIIESLDSAIGGDRAIGDDGRIHTTYVQTGSQTGRLSSTDPNLQNIPVRTEESRRIRAAFEVGDGYETLLTADYSQIEMRIMAHLSEDPGLIEAFNSGEDLHRFVGARV
ncbi:MAG: DNA polymerase I, partial [Microbacterium sp.]